MQGECSGAELQLEPMSSCSGFTRLVSPPVRAWIVGPPVSLPTERLAAFAVWSPRVMPDAGWMMAQWVLFLICRDLPRLPPPAHASDLGCIRVKVQWPDGTSGRT